MAGRALLLAGLLAAATAAAQDGASCQEQCGSKMAACVSRCGENAGCARNCSDRYDSCASRCAAAPKQAAALKGRACVDARGKPQKCPEKGPTRTPGPLPKEDPQDNKPNQAAKELMKDPNFRVVPQGAQ